jgi:exodeoxyribonuclease VII large subunit
MRPRVWTVDEVIRRVNTVLEGGFSSLQVEGELSNVTTSARGHHYFSLKDENASLDCVLWASRAGRLRFRVEDGLAVIAHGALQVYAQRGRLQLVVDALEPQGLGALQLAFEQLKRRLSTEGLFAAERKRPLPALPNRVGIVTSLSGAALHDMLRVLRRWRHLEVVVADARVQGEGAAAEIAAGIGRLAGSELVDLVIVARGGGSLEDLWAFNEEPVARAIAASPVPVITGVGHEVDFTIADFVADLRATTPTQAAELVVAGLEAQDRRLRELQAALGRDLRRHLQLARTCLAGLEGSSGLAAVPRRLGLLRQRLERCQRLDGLVLRTASRTRHHLEALAAVLRRVPTRVAAGGHRRLIDSRRDQLRQLMAACIAKARSRMSSADGALQHLSPMRVLERGYSMTTVEGSSTPLTRADAARPGQVLVTRLAAGSVRSVVTGSTERRKRPTPPGARQPSLFEEEDS